MWISNECDKKKSKNYCSLCVLAKKEPNCFFHLDTYILITIINIIQCSFCCMLQSFSWEKTRQTYTEIYVILKYFCQFLSKIFTQYGCTNSQYSKKNIESSSLQYFSGMWIWHVWKTSSRNSHWNVTIM